MSQLSVQQLISDRSSAACMKPFGRTAGSVVCVTRIAVSQIANKTINFYRQVISIIRRENGQRENGSVWQTMCLSTRKFPVCPGVLVSTQAVNVAENPKI